MVHSEGLETSGNKKPHCLDPVFVDIIYLYTYIYIYDICMLPFLATNQLLAYLRLYEGFLTPGHPHTSSELFNSRFAVL